MKDKNKAKEDDALHFLSKGKYGLLLLDGSIGAAQGVWARDSGPAQGLPA